MGHTSTWLFTLTANSAGVYMLKLCSPGPHKPVYFLRRLRAFDISTNVLLLFYRATIESVRYMAYANLSVHSKSQLQRTTSTKIIGCGRFPSLQEIFEQALVPQARRICSDARLVMERSRVRVPVGAEGEFCSPASTFSADSYFGIRSTSMLAQ